MESFYERLRRIMDSKGITPYRVAKDIGIDQSNFTRWSRGEYVPGYKTIKLLSDYLDVSTDYLLVGEQGEETTHLVRGDHMHPYIMDGDILTIKRTNVGTGKIVVAEVNGETVCRKIVLGEHTMLVPFNVNYDPVICDNATIIGEVVEIKRKL